MSLTLCLYSAYLLTQPLGAEAPAWKVSLGPCKLSLVVCTSKPSTLGCGMNKQLNESDRIAFPGPYLAQVWVQ